MKAIAFNASPRRKGNTATILEAILDGARMEGAKTELVHLTDLDMKGCQACGHCSENPGHCAYEDGFLPYLEKVVQSDVVLLGTPIYIFQETALCKSLIERLYCFIRVENNPDTGERHFINHFPRGKKFGFVISQRFPERDEYRNIIDYLRLIGGFLSGQECEVLLQTGTTSMDDARSNSVLLEQAKELGRKLAAP